MEPEITKPYVKKKFYSKYKNLDRASYDIEKKRLQAELLNLQYWLVENDQRLAICLDGRDAAGKGGTIKRFTEYLNPKHYRVVELGKPTPAESRSWLNRYSRRLPKKGEIVFFDRSWYNRALIEPTMGYCTERQYRYFMKKVIDWEHELIANGMMLIKFYLSVDSETQLFRFKERVLHPLKYWKYTKNDERARIKWRIFSKFKKQMLDRTSTNQSPWVVVDSNDKFYCRLSCMLYAISRIPYLKRQDFQPLDGTIISRKYRLELNGVTFNNLTHRQFVVLDRLKTECNI